MDPALSLALALGRRSKPRLLEPKSSSNASNGLRSGMVAQAGLNLVLIFGSRHVLPKTPICCQQDLRQLVVPRNSKVRDSGLRFDPC